MRKRLTTTQKEINPNPDKMISALELEQLLTGKTMPRFIAAEYKPSGDIMNILLRICDACHEMQNETEPWASIRMDIEKLR